MWIDFRTSLWQIVVLYEIYRGNWKRANTFVHCLYIVSVSFDWTIALSAVCFWSVHNSMNVCVPELHFFCATNVNTAAADEKLRWCPNKRRLNAKSFNLCCIKIHNSGMHWSHGNGEGFEKNDKIGKRFTSKNHKDYTVLFKSSCMSKRCWCTRKLYINVLRVGDVMVSVLASPWYS